MLSVAGSLNGDGAAPVGCIILWSGAANNIPEGWALCNGQTVEGQKTPDLSGRFVVGYDPKDGDYNAVGKTGGEKTHRLTVAEMPSHNHSITMWGGDIADDWKKQNNLDLTHDKWSDQRNTRYTDPA
ncbi:MAG: tail fiber protein, partial [Planctomycetes bacterium]|nr:tail fiber protein [Planctomycetota bacterium]